MAILLKIRWDIADGRESGFRENQEKLSAVMRDDHPGIICYHVDYAAPGVSEWLEIYANDDTLLAHLAKMKGNGALASVIGACAKITSRCWGNPDAKLRKILEGFGTTYHETAEPSFALHPLADPASLI